MSTTSTDMLTSHAHALVETEHADMLVADDVNTVNESARDT